MIEFNMSYEDKMTYYALLTKKMRKLYIRNAVIELIKAEIKQRSRLLYNREMKMNSYLGQKMILDIVSEKVAREVKAINDRNPTDYNRVCELYGLPRIERKDADYKRMMKHETQFIDEYVAPRRTPTEYEIEIITNSVVER
ncbi:hypothetical protein VCRA2126O85_240023 [Vibrio crassostreae]|nr:hypothetical protein VCRA2128O106_220022 [Vibrio crassostreae]CAK2766792.1 hypothetical protein VCRA2128O100_240021 [Vibrio crassostreae]CAK2770401.1 hypothetical protein VCRA2125O83_220059 [Vibrio crassostreae]CAK2775840.1 hypothetical protein VCRA2127O91_240058 [Vibrio crassostreae]CAK2777528.1 hypothetical protein VCRA2126O85_240023 [Vibrio crassostreae]